MIARDRSADVDGTEHCVPFEEWTAHPPSGQTVALGMVSAAIIVVPTGIHQTGAALLTPGWIVMGLAAALLSSAIPYSLEMIAPKSIPANSLGVLLSVEPAVGAIIGAIVLGELLTGLQWLAVTLVVGASIGMVLMGKAVKTP